MTIVGDDTMVKKCSATNTLFLTNSVFIHAETGEKKKNVQLD